MEERIPSGVPGLDEVLGGGFLPGRAYLVRGGPGCGKTTLGLQFLVEGARRGEPVLLVTLNESAESIRENAQRLEIPTEGVHILDLSPGGEFFARGEVYDIFSAAEVEREPLTQRIVEEVERLRPRRVFVDSLTQFRYLTADVFQFRKQVLSFFRFLAERGATILFTSEASAEAPDEDLQFLSDGILHLRYDGGRGRVLLVSKFRGSDFLEGYHSYRIGPGGLKVFPRVIPPAPQEMAVRERLGSGIPELDALLGGGLERGTVTVISGPSGVGKSTLAAQFAVEAARRKERASIYFFEENPAIFIQRCEAIGLPVREFLAHKLLAVQYVEPLIYTPEEFTRLVLSEVEREGTTLVVLDSVRSYLLALRGEGLSENLHALSRTLSNSGVSVFLINEVENVVGDFKLTEVGISHLADNLLVLRYLEIRGELRRAIGVVKKRLGDFEKTLREFAITDQGLRLGEPLTRLRGILRGVPEILE